MGHFSVEISRLPGSVLSGNQQIDLCALAGLPLQARRFLETGASLDEVRAALLAARADATPEVTALHPQPGRSADARPWGEVIARTFKPRG